MEADTWTEERKEQAIRAHHSQFSLPLMAVLSVQQKLFAEGKDFAGAEVFRGLSWHQMHHYHLPLEQGVWD